MLILFERILNPLLGMSITAAFVAVVVILLRAILKNRAPKQVVCLLWLLVFARLLVPVMVESPFSLVPNALESVVQVEQNEVQNQPEPSVPVESITPAPTNKPVIEITPAVTPGNPVPSLPVSNPTQDPVTEVPPVIEPSLIPEVPPAEEPEVQEPTVEPTSNAPLWMPVLAAAWLTGVAVMLVVGIGSYIKLRRHVYDAIRAIDGVWEHPSLASPFILGLIRPKIYLPMGIEGQSRTFILHHERAHLRRLDHVVKPICWLALAIHWFNPLAWVAFLLMSRDIETACDESVIRQLGSEVKADYSATLLALATDKRFPAPSPLSFGEGDAKVRIKNVLKFKKPALWVSIIAIVVVIVAAVCLLTDPVKEEEFTVPQWASKLSAEDMEYAGLRLWQSDGQATGFDLTEPQKEELVDAILALPADAFGEVEGLLSTLTVEEWLKQGDFWSDPYYIPEAGTILISLTLKDGCHAVLMYYQDWLRLTVLAESSGKWETPWTKSLRCSVENKALMDCILQWVDPELLKSDPDLCGYATDPAYPGLYFLEEPSSTVGTKITAYKLIDGELVLVGGYEEHMANNFTGLIRPDGESELLFLSPDEVYAMFEELLAAACWELDPSWTPPREELLGVSSSPTVLRHQAGRDNLYLDLDGDGTAERVEIFATEVGGGNFFDILTVYDKDGSPVSTLDLVEFMPDPHYTDATVTVHSNDPNWVTVQLDLRQADIPVDGSAYAAGTELMVRLRSFSNHNLLWDGVHLYLRSSVSILFEDENNITTGYTSVGGVDFLYRLIYQDGDFGSELASISPAVADTDFYWEAFLIGDVASGYYEAGMTLLSINAPGAAYLYETEGGTLILQRNGHLGPILHSETNETLNLQSVASAFGVSELAAGPGTSGYPETPIQYHGTFISISGGANNLTTSNLDWDETAGAWLGEWDFSVSSQVPHSEPISPLGELFLSALNDEVQIVDPGLGMTGTLSELVAATAPSVEMNITEIAAVDLDGDGIEEVLLLLETPGTVHGTMILCYDSTDGQIYAYELWLRAFSDVKTDGTFYYSSSSAVGGVARISFHAGGYMQEPITYSEGAGNQYSFYVNKQPATEREYEAAREEWQAQPGVIWLEYTSENTDLLLREHFTKVYDHSMLTRTDALPDESAILYADADGKRILQIGEHIGPISDDVWPVTATGFSVTLTKTDSGSIALRCRNQVTSGLDVSVHVIWSSEAGMWVRNGESIDNNSKQLPRELVTPDTLPTDPEEYYLVAALPENHVYLYAKNHGEDSMLLWNGNFWWPLTGRTAHTPRMNLPRLYLMDENAQTTTVAAISERFSGTEVSVEQLVVYVMGEHQVDSSYYIGLRQSVYDWSSVHEAFNKKNTLVYDADTNSFTVFWNGRVYNSGELPQDMGQWLSLEDGYIGSLFANGDITKFAYIGGNRFTVTVKTAVEDRPVSIGETGLDLTWTVEFNGEGFDLVGEINLGSEAGVNQSSSAAGSENGAAELPNGWKLNDFTIAGFDKDGLGDFGYRAVLSENELKSLPELLDLSEWRELANPPEYGLTVCLALSDSEAERFLYVLDGMDGKAVIKLSDPNTGESFVYLASGECITYAKALAAVLKDRAS